MSEDRNNISLAEERVLDFWEQAKIFEQSVEREAPRGDYVFYDGPPFATGDPHYGHVVGSVIKDAIPRYFTMNAYRVERKWGWDCHGLPIENIVEKEMNTKSKKDIEVIGINKFNKACRSKIMTYTDNWEKFIPRLGRWVDMKSPYRTMDLDYMESVWWVFKELWDKGYIYKDYRSMHVCPRCETTLSQSEVAEGYRDVKDLTVTAKFKLLDEDNTYLLAWTTTPWTLIANVALALGEEITYVKIQVNDQYYILAKERLEEVMKDKEYKIVKEFVGKDLLGKKYKAVFDYYQDNSLDNYENGWKVYAADFVNTEEGTGIVHIAPAFGEDDMNLGKEKNLPFVQHIGLDGYFKEEVKDFPKLNVKPRDDYMTTDVEIVKYLAGKDLLFSKAKYEHSYPHCWRCDTPLINYATSSWFVNVIKMKDRLLDLAKNINWSPQHIKNGRFGKWLEGAHDWSISRQRFWANTIPIWECECGERKVMGSVKELEDLTGEKITDIHNDKIDHLTITCSKCQRKMKRIPDVFDCWFESASMPYAQVHYPFENKKKFEKTFPAQFIAEGVDQTRTWFYYLHVISGGIKDSQAFNNAIVNGIVLAEDGKKMSKRLQNYPDPVEVINKYGADALRMAFLSSPIMQAENLNFSEKAVQEALQKNVMLINNIYRFYSMYALEKIGEQESTNVLDIWIKAKLQILLKTVTIEMNNYNLFKAVRPITTFIDELSTWYLRRSRERFKKGGDNTLEALNTTKYILLELAKIIAPFMPFIAEKLWQDVSGNNYQHNNRSVHLELWSKYRDLNKQENLVINTMEEVRKIVELGLAKRDELKIKIRQALNKISIKSNNLKLNDDYLGLLKDELNVKEVEIINDDRSNLEIDLDTNITPELKQEGLKRDLVRYINMLRKEAGLSISDRASVELSGLDEEMRVVVDKYKEDIMMDTLSDRIDISSEKSEGGVNKEAKINNSLINIMINK